MRSELDISLLSEVKLPDAVREQFARSFIRICLLIYLLPAAMLIYRHLVLEPNPIWIVVAFLYGITAFLSLRQNILQPKLQIIFAIALLCIAALTIKVQTQSITSVSATVLLASIAAMTLIGMWRAMILAVLFLCGLFAFYFYLEPGNIHRDLISMTLAVAAQIGILITINLIWGLFIASREWLERTLRLTEIASTQTGVALFRRVHETDRWMVNEVYRQVFDIKDRNELHGYDHLLRACAPSDKDRLLQWISRELPIGESLTFEHQFFVDRLPHWFKLTVNVVEEDAGPVSYGSIIDIHQQKLSQNELARSHKETSDLIDQLTLATQEGDIRIIEENLTTGTSRYLASGRSPRPYPATRAERRQMIPTEYYDLIDQAYEVPGVSVEYPIRDTDYVTGTEWLRQRCIKTEERDGERFVIFMITNITQDKKAQIKLEQSLTRIEEALSRQEEIAKAGQIGLFEWATESDLLRANDIFREQTGLDKARFPLLRINDLIDLLDELEGAAFAEQMRKSTPSDGAWEFQFKIESSVGSDRWLRIMASVHDSETGQKKIYGSTVDLTEQLNVQARLEDANASLELQTRTDPLTKLANRRQMDEYLATQLNLRNRTANSSFTLVMVDIDYFKKYNDHYGHPAGDSVLQTVAQIMVETARRPADLVARFGGEEFILILPDTDKNGAKLICAKLREALAEANIEHLASPLNRLTLSLGIATLSPGKLAAAPDLIQAADEALYRAKAGGRDRAEIIDFVPVPQRSHSN